MLPYIKLFGDNSATIDLLSDAEAGRLLKALLHYNQGKETQLVGQEKLVFAMLKAQIDRDAASYQSFIDKQRENGKKGGRPKNPENPTLTQTNPKNPSLFEKTQKSQEKEKEEEKEKDKEEEVIKRKRFTPPTSAEVAQYCRERNNNVNADRFIDFYSSKGWRVGNQPMKDWKAAVRTWEHRDNIVPIKKVTAQQYTQRERSRDEWNALDDMSL